MDIETETNSNNSSISNKLKRIIDIENNSSKKQRIQTKLSN